MPTFRLFAEACIASVWLSAVSLGTDFAHGEDALQIRQEVTLSAGHDVTPYRVLRASNGDYLVAGAVGSDNRSWAVRVSAEGARIWEFVDGGADGWTDGSRPGQRFFDVVELADHSVVLCGMKFQGKRPTAFLVRLRADGTTLNERVLGPRNAEFSVGVRCARWGDGVAIAGASYADPHAFGWLSKLDAQGEVAWEKSGDNYGQTDLMAAPNGGLFLLTPLGHPGAASIVSLDSQGELIGRQALPEDASDFTLVRPESKQSGVEVVYMRLNRRTEIATFPSDLRGPPKTRTLNDAGIMSALKTAAGEVVIFGSQFKGAATASIARMSASGTGTSMVLKPAFKSPWIFDAVPSGAPNEFAMTRRVDNVAKLAWIALR